MAHANTASAIWEINQQLCRKAIDLDTNPIQWFIYQLTGCAEVRFGGGKGECRRLVYLLIEQGDRIIQDSSVKGFRKSGIRGTDIINLKISDNLLIYVKDTHMQSNKIHNVVLMSKFYSTLFNSSTYFGPHRSIFRSVLCKLHSQTLVCGTTVRTTRHVQPLQSNDWMCPAVRVLPHTTVCEYSLYKTLLMMDR